MLPVEADSFEAVGYLAGTRQLVIKFQRPPTLCFENVPRFRFDGLMDAPRKDAYFDTFIKNHFLHKEVTLPSPA